MTQRHTDSDEETYVSVGSAFERLETAEDVQKAKERKEKEQYVTDKQGRRRFHGAFTGGFSAGYFNTVGTKEGWAPSSFISSRDKKADFSRQKPEDFMDEEDLDEYGIAPRTVAAREQFSGQKISGVKRSQSSVIPGDAPLSQLIVPARSSVAIRLMQAMGWREGQGVGPRVIKYPANQPKGTKIIGPTLRTEEEGEEGEGVSNAAKGFHFAPRDSALWQVEGKDDLHGIGYRGMQDQAVLQVTASSKALYGMSGQAFGVGALEEEEEDDDVYGVESMMKYESSVAAEGEGGEQATFGWTGGHEQDSWSLSAFAKASIPTDRLKVLGGTKYPPPAVPRDFVPLHKFGLQHTSTLQEMEPPEHSQVLTDKPGSVFSLMSVEDRERLKQAKEKAQQRTAPATMAAATPTSSSVEHRSVEGETNQPRRLGGQPAAHSGIKAEATAAPSSTVGGAMTEWERQKERESLSHAGQSLRHLASSSLSSRFTRAGGEGAGEEVKEEESDAQQAAKAGMFGVLTREVLDWHPHRVVCKRFNIPDPYPGSVQVGVVAEPSRARGDRMEFLLTEKISSEPQRPASGREYPENKPEPSDRVSAASKTEQPASETVPMMAPSEEREEPKDEELEPRPPMDLFKAIFAESSSDSEVESEPDVESAPPPTSSSNHNSLASTAPTISGKASRQWQDLSTIASTFPPLLLEEREHLHSSNGSTQRPETVTEQPPQAVYGPPLPPADQSFEEPLKPHKHRKKPHRHKHKSGERKHRHRGH